MYVCGIRECTALLLISRLFQHAAFNDDDPRLGDAYHKHFSFGTLPTNRGAVVVYLVDY